MLIIETLTPSDELAINGDRCKFWPCFSAHKPVIFRSMLAIHFPRQHAESVHTNSRRSTSKQNMRSGERKIGKWGCGGWRIKYRACHICAAIWLADQRYHKIRPTCANVRAEMNDFSDEWKSTFSAMESCRHVSAGAAEVSIGGSR